MYNFLKLWSNKKCASTQVRIKSLAFQMVVLLKQVSAFRAEYVRYISLLNVNIRGMFLRIKQWSWMLPGVYPTTAIQHKKTMKQTRNKTKHRSTIYVIVSRWNQLPLSTICIFLHWFLFSFCSRWFLPTENELEN